MGLHHDEATGRLLYNGREVGECLFKQGVACVTFTFTYEGGPDNWFVPLSWFFRELDRISPKPEILLRVETGPDSLAQPLSGRRLLTEREVKVAGCVWRFYKTDPDPWPSALHGHDYDRHLKLDVLTGDIYDVATRQKISSLKSRDLEQVRNELRRSRDYAKRVANLIDAPAAALPPAGGD